LQPEYSDLIIKEVGDKFYLYEYPSIASTGIIRRHPLTN
jgi:hypothetical protein